MIFLDSFYVFLSTVMETSFCRAFDFLVVFRDDFTLDGLKRDVVSKEKRKAMLN